MEFFDFLIFVLGLWAIFVIASWVWNRKDPIDEMVEVAKSAEKDFDKVSDFEENHKDLPTKLAKINEFKKKGVTK